MARPVTVNRNIMMLLSSAAASLCTVRCRPRQPLNCLPALSSVPWSAACRQHGITAKIVLLADVLHDILRDLAALPAAQTAQLTVSQRVR